MSVVSSEPSTEVLQAIADRVVAMAEPGEQLEAYVSRESETAVRIYEGEVEHLTSAHSSGVPKATLSRASASTSAMESSSSVPA